MNKVVKGNAQFVKNLWTLRKSDSATPKNILQKSSEGTCDYLRYVTLLIYFRWRVVLFLGVIRNIFLFSVLFNVHNKGIATELTKKMDRQHSAGQLSCNAHIALVWQYLTYYFIWYRIVDLD